LQRYQPMVINKLVDY